MKLFPKPYACQTLNQANCFFEEIFRINLNKRQSSVNKCILNKVLLIMILFKCYMPLQKLNAQLKSYNVCLQSLHNINTDVAWNKYLLEESLKIVLCLQLKCSILGIIELLIQIFIFELVRILKKIKSNIKKVNGKR